MISFAQPQCFTGHKDAVIDITSYGNDSSTIASSSEDKTIRLWDLRTGKARQCITGFGRDPVNIIKYAPYDSNRIFGMTDTSILSFDIRREGLIVTDSHSTVYTVDTVQGEEELCDLSSFSIHPKENMHSIAIGDDNGTVSLLDTQSGAIVKRLSGVHSNVIGAVSFQPNSLNYLCSGGFDSQFCCWDVSRSRPSGEVIDFSRDQLQQQQMANPPFVHDLLYQNGGKRVVVAVGDGSLRLLTYVAKQGFVMSARKEDAHGGMTTAVCTFCPMALAKQSCVMSAGIDCVVKGWSIQEGVEGVKSGGKAVQSIAQQQDTSSKSQKNKKKKNKKKQSNASSSDSTTQESTVLSGEKALSSADTFDLLFSINHKEKINAIGMIEDKAPGGGKEGGGGSSGRCGIFVADVTPTWKLYLLRD